MSEITDNQTDNQSDNTKKTRQLINIVAQALLKKLTSDTQTLLDSSAAEINRRLSELARDLS